MPGAHSTAKTKGPGRRLLTFVLPVAVLVVVVGGVAGVFLAPWLDRAGGRFPDLEP